MNKPYLGVDRSVQLRHWKYIKKKRGKNGKWIYYYDKKALKNDVKDVLGYDEKERLDKAFNKVIRTKGEAERLEGNYHGYQKYLNDTYKRPPFLKSDGTMTKDVQEQYNKEAKKLPSMLKAYEKATSEYAKAGKEYTKAKTEFHKTPLGALDQLKSTVTKGANAIKRLLGID